MSLPHRKEGASFDILIRCLCELGAEERPRGDMGLAKLEGIPHSVACDAPAVSSSSRHPEAALNFSDT